MTRVARDAGHGNGRYGYLCRALPALVRSLGINARKSDLRGRRTIVCRARTAVRPVQATALESSNDLGVLIRLKPEAYECLDRSRTRVTHRTNRPPMVSTISGVNSA